MKKNLRYPKPVIFLVSAFFLLTPFSLRSQDPGSSWNYGASSPAVSTAPGGDTQAERTADGKYYLDFKAASLINVLSVLSNLSGINFVAGREVADRQVNMTLDGVTLEDVLDAISNSCNVTYDLLPGRNIYLFRASADSVDKPKLFTRVFKLYYVQVSKMKEIESSTSSSSSTSSGTSSSGSTGGGLVTLSTSDNNDDTDLENSAIVKAIEKILSERGKVSVDDRSNSLIVTDTEDRLKMIESAITQLDRPLNQVLINVLLVETFEDLSRDLGLTWGDTNGFFGTISGGVQDTNFPFYTGSHRSSNPFGASEQFVKNIAQQFNFTKSTGPITAPGERDFSAFQVTLQAMESASKLKILAKPKILVLDNHPALIKIATNAAIGTQTETSSAGGGAIGTTIERAEIGTILRVTPLINTGERVTMTVEPTFATVDRSAITVSAVAGQQTGDPTARTARTTMMVNDGQTIALGGMLFSNQSNGNRKVPFFGNLPVVGKALFTSNTKSLQDRELILFVTPNIITNPSMLESTNVPENRLRYDDEAAPWWKVKQKQWYKEMKEGPEKDLDFDSYFNVRKRLIDSTLDTLDQTAKAPAKGKP
jgi:type II secretory pathway component GspD/PulD (secretin)